MTRPLVSVMMPCFNAVDTLPLALASVTAQSVDDWECICLDDGSQDGTWDVLVDVAKRDPRFRIERFAENRGRGAARQRALELATGKYLAFLDSDDWMFPERLAVEARWLDVDDDIITVCVCAAVTNGQEELVGLMRPQSQQPLPIVAAFDEPVPPPLLFPPSMIRTDVAQRTGFDPAFLRSQDSDFLIRAMLGHHYALAREVLYAYSQASAASLQRTLDGYRFRMRGHLKHFKDYPVRVSRTLAETSAKILTYRAAGMLGMDQRLIARRWGPVDDETRRSFDIALATVKAAAKSLFAS